MTAIPSLRPASVMAGNAWRNLLLLLLLMAAVLLLFRETTAAMVGIWIRSETFAHAFLVPPIVVWLVWRKRAELALLQPRPAPWFLLPIAAVCALWLLGELASVNSATQFALVALLVLTVPALFGTQVARALTFPLLFLFFAVPFGEFMVPHMMEWTADFTIAAVRASGVPVYREGLQFVIPSGHWSVVEACSGVRYLIASFMVGTLFAYLNFYTPWKRAAFIAVSLLMPIVANWLRAYLIVMIGHLSDNKLAAGVDHLIYGWVFFGIVIGAMFMIGARYAEPDPVPVGPTGTTGATANRGSSGRGAAPSSSSASSDRPASRLAPTLAVTAGMLVILLATQAVFWKLDQASDRATPVLALPAAPGGDAPAFSTWVPAWQNPSLAVSRSYRSLPVTATSAIGDSASLAAATDATPVALWVGYYRDQGYARKLVSSANVLAEAQPEGAEPDATAAAGPRAAPDWSQTAAGSQTVTTSAGALTFRTADLRGANDPGAAGADRLRVWHIYWIDGEFVSSDARAKLKLAFNRLLGHGDDSAVLILSTPLGDGAAAVADAAAHRAADGRLQRWVDTNFQALVGSLDAARRAN